MTWQIACHAVTNWATELLGISVAEFEYLRLSCQGSIRSEYQAGMSNEEGMASAKHEAQAPLLDMLQTRQSDFSLSQSQWERKKLILKKVGKRLDYQQKKFWVGNNFFYFSFFGGGRSISTMTALTRCSHDRLPLECLEHTVPTQIAVQQRSEKFTKVLYWIYLLVLVYCIALQLPSLLWSFGHHLLQYVMPRLWCLK